jgi:hypothetical protein
MLFDWLITGQIVPMNPAAAVRGPKHVVKTGKTPVLEGDEWRKLLGSIPTTTLRDLRDRALIATRSRAMRRFTGCRRAGSLDRPTHQLRRRRRPADLQLWHFRP